MTALATLQTVNRVMRCHMPASHSLNYPILLLALTDRPQGLGMGEAGTLCGISTASITLAVDAMETAGLIRRTYPKDRRKVELALTDRGRGVVLEMGIFGEAGGKVPP